MLFSYVGTHLSQEEGMAAHASILAWRIPWTEVPGYSLWCCKESDTTMRLSTAQHRHTFNTWEDFYIYSFKLS